MHFYFQYIFFSWKLGDTLCGKDISKKSPRYFVGTLFFLLKEPSLPFYMQIFLKSFSLRFFSCSEYWDISISCSEYWDISMTDLFFLQFNLKADTWFFAFISVTYSHAIGYQPTHQYIITIARISARYPSLQDIWAGLMTWINQYMHEQDLKRHQDTSIGRVPVSEDSEKTKKRQSELSRLWIN